MSKVNYFFTFQGTKNIGQGVKFIGNKIIRRYLSGFDDIGHLEVMQHYNIIPGETCTNLVILNNNSEFISS